LATYDKSQQTTVFTGKSKNQRWVRLVIFHFIRAFFQERNA